MIVLIVKGSKERKEGKGKRKRKIGNREIECSILTTTIYGKHLCSEGDIIKLNALIV